MKNVLKLATVAALLLSSSSVFATVVVAKDNFDSYTTGSLNGKNGGTGFASGWVTAGDAAVTNTAPLQGTDSVLFSANSNNAATRQLTSTISRDVTIRFKFQYNGPLENNDFLALWFGNSDGPNIGLKANCGANQNDVPTCFEDGFARTGMDSDAKFLLGSNLTAGQTYTFFGHLYKSAGSAVYNRYDAWLDPSTEEMATFSTPDAAAVAKANSLDNIASFSTIGFRTANLNNQVTVLVDDIELSVVPEPASLALFGTSLLALAGIRRRRQQ